MKSFFIAKNVADEIFIIPWSLNCAVYDRAPPLNAARFNAHVGNAAQANILYGRP